MQARKANAHHADHLAQSEKYSLKRYVSEQQKPINRQTHTQTVTQNTVCG